MRPSLKFNEGKQGQGKVLISSLLKRNFATDLKKKTERTLKGTIFEKSSLFRRNKKLAGALSFEFRLTFYKMKM